MAMSDFRPEKEIWPFGAYAMHPAVIILSHRRLGYGADTTFYRMYL